MNRFVVRPVLRGESRNTGKEGATGITVRAENAEAAKRQGAAMLGLSPSEVEVFDSGQGMGDTLIVNLPPDVLKAALEKRGDQDTGMYKR